MSRLRECFSPARLRQLASEGGEDLDRCLLLAHLGTGCSRCRKALCRLAMALQPGELEPASIRRSSPGAAGRIFTGQQALDRARSGRGPAASPDPVVHALRRALQVEAGRLETVGLLPAHAWVARHALRSPLGFPRLVLEELQHGLLFGPPSDPLARLMRYLRDLVSVYRWIQSRRPEPAGLYFADRFAELLALAWIYLGDDAFCGGQPEIGARALRVARRLLDSLRGDPKSVTSPRRREVLAALEETQGEWARQHGQIHRARRCFETAEELLRESSAPHLRLSAQIRRATALFMERDFTTAAILMRQVEPAARASGHGRVWLEAVHIRAAIELESGELLRARHRLEVSARLYPKWGDPWILGQREWMLGLLHLCSGSPLSRWLGHFQVAWALLQRAGAREQAEALVHSCFTCLLSSPAHHQRGEIS